MRKNRSTLGFMRVDLVREITELKAHMAVRQAEIDAIDAELARRVAALTEGANPAGLS